MKKERERSWERERERERMENERERSNYILAMLMLICSEGHSLPPIFVKTSATKTGSLISIKVIALAISQKI